MKNQFLCTSAMLIGVFTLTGCLDGGIVSPGTSSTAVTGSAGGASSVDASADLERCDKTLGTLAFDDGRQSDWWWRFSQATKVTNIEPLLRVAVQQSNCFVLTSIGNVRLNERMSAITGQQRESGEFRAGSNQQKGQRVAADYFMEPSIIIDDDTTGGVGGVVGSVLGGTLGAIAGGLQTKASVVTMTMFDIRSQVQIAAAEGSATATNYGTVAAAFGGSSGGALSAFSRTPEGKATVAAFLDAYNGMVVALRNYEAQNVEGGLGTGGTLEVN
ncbi:MAG: hypothetical protein ACFB6S_17370 [Geminicoccaceae bacterium]